MWQLELMVGVAWSAVLISFKIKCEFTGIDRLAVSSMDMRMGTVV